MDEVITQNALMHATCQLELQNIVNTLLDQLPIILALNNLKCYYKTLMRKSICASALFNQPTFVYAVVRKILKVNKPPQMTCLDATVPPSECCNNDRAKRKESHKLPLAGGSDTF